MKQIAALYVIPDGPYFNQPGVDLWDEAKDARLYPGPHPVIAHPPCARWGKYWFYGGPGRRHVLGDDVGCFEAALQAVRKWGGVLEHPEGSHAWRQFQILRPPKYGGWKIADAWGFTCCVEQGNYGHPARKATWLYVSGVSIADLPFLKWGRSSADRKVDDHLSKCQRMLTPEPFRDLLINIARSVKTNDEESIDKEGES